ALDLAQPWRLLDDTTIDWPSPAAWTHALRASHWVAEPACDAIADASRPLVLDGGLLYLRRYREYERRLAAGLRRLAAAPAQDVDADALAVLFAALFAEREGNDDQARAAAVALQQPLLLVTGGPGTGKTTTIARVLLLLIAQRRARFGATSHWAVENRDSGFSSAHGASPLRIALAAPTGRAAEGMASRLRVIAAQLREVPGVDAALCAALPTAASTLHRLLGTIPDSPRFRHDAANPLPFDVVVVDEASMVDLPLMCKLVEAVPDGARLILLGDRDQLPSVEAGDVLAAIGDAMGVDAPLPASLPAHAPDTSLRGHRVHLRRGYRQSPALDLAPLSDAVRDGDGERALDLLRDGALAGVQFHDALTDPLRGPTRDALLAPWRALQACDDPSAALCVANRVRLLTALRDGPQGARQLNARIEEALAGVQRSAYFHGRLLLISENSPRHGLFNGDIGVCLRDGDGTLAWFAGDRGSDGGDDDRAAPRRFHPSALPAHDGAFAMTVHKAQGSEFDAVWLLLPARDARTLSRELVYTALTRARDAVHLCASADVLRAALSRHAQRVSGLAARLAGG
ncbi:MAG: exodeoxyribonuclease V subunit alpha, partial [Luteimonas sp.]